jgi:hypothetical protein
MKRQAIFKDFKRFGAFKGLVEQKNVVFNSFVCKFGFFGTRGPLKRSFHSRFKLVHSCQKTQIYTRTRQINYYYVSRIVICIARLRNPTLTNREKNCRQGRFAVETRQSRGGQRIS